MMLIGLAQVIVGVPFWTLSVSPGLTMLPCVAVIDVVPTARPVARPVALIEANVGTDDAQVTELEMLDWVPSENVPVAVNCCVRSRRDRGIRGRHRDRRQSHAWGDLEGVVLAMPKPAVWGVTTA